MHVVLPAYWHMYRAAAPIAPAPAIMSPATLIAIEISWHAAAAAAWRGPRMWRTASR